MAGYSEPETPKSTMSEHKIRSSLLQAENTCEILYARMICLLLLSSK